MAKSLDIIDPKKELDSDNSAREEEDMVRAAPSHEEGGGGLFYLIIGIVAVIVSTSLALYILFKDDNKTDQKAAVASTTATVTPATSTTASSQAVVSSVATTATAAAATPASGSFKYTNEQIRIANGNGISGEGAKVQKLLEGKGYAIASVGNASKQYEASIIYYKTGKEALAEALKKDIASAYTATVEKSDTTVGSYDAVVVLGAK